jgi:hypothetical protein
MSRTERPLGVTIIAALQILGVIIIILFLIGIPILLYNLELEYLLDTPAVKFTFFYSLIMIPIVIILAIGLLKGKEYARVITIVLQIASIIITLFTLSVSGILSIFISGIIIIYLSSLHVRNFFNQY